MRSVLFYLYICSFAQAEFPSFVAFGKILEKNLETTDLPGGGFQSAFRYKKAFKDPEFAKLVKEQKSVLEKFDTNQLKTKEEATAFWINTYNFFMIAKIYKEGWKKDKLKLNSVKDMGGFFDPYAAFKEEDFKVGGKKMTLDGIEKGILLGDGYKTKKWKDARIHFAVNCASVGCPALLKAVYKPETVDATLTDNVKKALKTKRHFHFEGDTLHLTYLFTWYKGDFADEKKSVKKWLLQFIDDPKLQEKVKKTKKFDEIDYDWNLNRPKNFKKDGSA